MQNFGCGKRIGALITFHERTYKIHRISCSSKRLIILDQFYSVIAKRRRAAAAISNSKYGLIFRKTKGNMLFLWFCALRKTIKTTKITFHISNCCAAIKIIDTFFRIYREKLLLCYDCAKRKNNTTANNPSHNPHSYRLLPNRRFTVVSDEKNNQHNSHDHITHRHGGINGRKELTEDG